MLDGYLHWVCYHVKDVWNIIYSLQVDFVEMFKGVRIGLWIRKSGKSNMITGDYENVDQTMTSRRWRWW
jgi:hypothetical protein